MLIVTDAAGECLTKMLRDINAPDGAVARFATESADVISLQPDKPVSGDTMFMHGGRAILVLDDQVARSLDGMTLDITDDGAGLALF